MSKLTRYCIDDLQSVSILSIAKDLGLKVTRQKKCLCPFHEDKKPSLKFWPDINGWKCFGCGEKGTVIDLVMKKEGLKFHEACEWIAQQHGILLRYEDGLQPGSPRNVHKPSSIDYKPSHIPSSKMYTLTSNLISQCQGIKSAFCQSIVTSGILSEQQLLHAADVYHLGCTNDDGVVFWQMDADGQLRDGKIMFYGDDCRRDHSRNPSWVSFRLKNQGILAQQWQATQCLFGLHQIDNQDENHVIAIVESEKTAIICSELIPDINNRPVIWMATGGLDALTVEALRPLIGYDVTIFPDTDTTGQTFKKWQDITIAASKELNHSFYISNLLEKHATKTQKERKIDIADFIIESKL